MAKTGFNAAVAWTQQSVNNALNGRLHIGSLFPAAAATAGMTSWRDGVVVTTNQGGSNNVPDDLQVKAATALNLTVDVGHCVITRSGNGPYLGYLSTQATVTLANADAVNPRIDLIVAQVYDTAIGDSVAGLTPSLSAPGGLVITPVTGTAAGSPVAPPTPTGAIVLAQVAVAANAVTITSGNITDKRRSAFNAGGGRTQLPGDVAVTDNGAVSGELRHTVGTSWPEFRLWSGTNWKPIGIPVYASTATRNTDLGSGGQYSGQLAVADYMLTGNYSGIWYNAVPITGAPALQVRASAGQTFTNNVYGTVAFDLEDTSDVFGYHDNVINNSRITVTIPGIYMLTGGIPFVTNATGQRGNRWLKNGTEIAGGQAMVNATGGTLSSLNSAKSIFVTLAISDYIELAAYQNSGGNLNTAATGSEHSTMSVMWVRG